MAHSRGDRIATVRRYLAIAMNEDLNAKRMEELFEWGGGMWSRWENNEMRPREDKLDAISALAARYGLTWVTTPWLDYGAGEGPPSVITGPVKEAPETPIVRKRKPAPKGGEVVKRRRSGGSK